VIPASSCCSDLPSADIIFDIEEVSIELEPEVAEWIDGLTAS
jgi:hypothetical protein